MRKIYPPPFNKFVVFVFYGILLIAIIVSAQEGTLMDNDCNAGNLKVNTNRQVIGYVQPDIDPNKIRWELYNYINFIVSDFSNPEKNKDNFTALINAKNTNGNNNVKILLSIRNYDVAAWKDGENNFYDTIVDKVGDAINNNFFDGLDIEYPGTRVSTCRGKINEGGFAGFIKNMKNKLQDKTIMLTVGSAPNEGIKGLIGDISLLNVETYHYSLYANLRTNYNDGNIGIKTNPNSPISIFSYAYNEWSKLINDKEKIIMGIDFGNTFQIVFNNPGIAYNQTVDYTYFEYDIPSEIRNQLIPIKNLCNAQADIALYSWPWRKLSTYALNSTTNGFCGTKDNWKRNFDHTNLVPWLYKPYSSGVNFNYFYISYEDFSSLHYKLSMVGGISISDISYDDDNNSLLNYIRGNNQLTSPTVELPPKNPNPGKGNSPLYPTDSINADDKNPLDNHKAKAGVIVGAVLGGLLLIVVSCFVWYRRRSLLNSKNAGAISKRSHTATKNVEMSCDSSPNRFAVPTTVIPVACGYVTAMFDFEGKEENDLSFKKGDKIEVLERGDGPNDWWVGRVNNTVGEFPGNYVKETG